MSYGAQVRAAERADVRRRTLDVYQASETNARSSHASAPVATASAL